MVGHLLQHSSYLPVYWRIVTVREDQYKNTWIKLRSEAMNWLQNKGVAGLICCGLRRKSHICGGQNK